MLFGIFKFPDIKRVHFQYVPEINEDLLKFLKHSSPKTPKIFTFGWNSSNLVKIDYYLEGLEIALKGTTKEVLLNYWPHTKESLERIVKASSNCTRFIIRNSKINCENEFDFSGPSYNISYFSLSYCGDYHQDGWSTNPERLGKIIKAISESTMKNKLTTFNINQWGVGVPVAKSLLVAYGMPDVIVTSEDNTPSTS